MNSLNSSPNPKTQRKYPRRQFIKPVAFLCHGLSQVAQGVEIGEGGVSFATNQILDVDDAVVVNFFVPQGDFYSLRAIVKSQVSNVHLAPSHGKFVYGLSFDEISLSLKRQIRAYVARMQLEK